MKSRWFLDRGYFMWEVIQNPCGCHPFDILMETKNKGFNRISICGARSQKDIEKFLKERFILELK